MKTKHKVCIEFFLFLFKFNKIKVYTIYLCDIGKSNIVFHGLAFIEEQVFCDNIGKDIVSAFGFNICDSDTWEIVGRSSQSLRPCDKTD
jgi:hypothetical protein